MIWGEPPRFSLRRFSPPAFFRAAFVGKAGHARWIWIFFVEKKCRASGRGRRFEGRGGFGFSFGGFVGKRKVSLLTELENVCEWFSTKVPSLRDFLFERMD
ncbi:MAG: hypothetical protein D6714_11045 [Bacteroidetes bacterium]|nr:MAG: hypothetical protein D6714_11045 [Bacteroidota bacterium]